MGYCACHRGGYNDQHGPNPGPIPAGDVKQLEAFFADPRFEAALQQYRNVNSSYNTPYLGGSDKAGTTVYQDRRFAQRVKQGLVKYDGRPYDPTPFVNLHEAVEGYGIRHRGMDYPLAHKLASAAERMAVEAAGGNWEKHTAAMRPEIRLAETERGQGTPPDLLVQPYENTKYWGEVTGNEGLKLPAAAGAIDQRLRAQAAGAHSSPQASGGGYTPNQSDDRGVEPQGDVWPGEPDKGQGAMRFYLVRHGKTALNRGGASSVDRIRGWSDVPLDETGKRQGKKLGKQLAGSGIQILAHSNLTRTKDTAEDIAKTTGAELVSAPLALRPWNVGIYTGADSNAAHPELQRMAMESPDEPIPKGESFTQFKCRVLSGVGEQSEKNAGKHIAYVTHHRVERLLHAWIDGGQKEDCSIDFNTFFQHGEDPANADCIALDPDKLAAAAQTACRELERIGPEKYSQKDAGFHEDHGPETKAHPEGTHCGVCRFFGGEGKCSQVESKPNHIGADDGCALFTNAEGTREMRKKGNKDGSGGYEGATNWDERDGPGGAVTGGRPMGDLGGHRYVRPGSLMRGGYDPMLPSSAPGQQFAGANLPSSMPAGSFSGAAPDTKVGGYGNANYNIGAGGPPKAEKPKEPSFHNHVLALGGLKHVLAAGHIDKQTHDKAVASARSAMASHKATKASMPKVKPPRAAPEAPAGASSGRGGMGGGVGLLPYPVSFMGGGDSDQNATGGYGGLGSLDPNFMSQGQGAMGGTKMPWQR